MILRLKNRKSGPQFERLIVQTVYVSPVQYSLQVKFPEDHSMHPPVSYFHFGRETRDHMHKDEYDIFPEGVRGILDLLRQDKATVGDRLAILKSNIAPDVNSLELGRVHHFMQSDEKTLDEEREIAHLIGKGISSVELESKSPAHSSRRSVRVNEAIDWWTNCLSR